LKFSTEFSTKRSRTRGFYEVMNAIIVYVCKEVGHNSAITYGLHIYNTQL